MIKLKLNNMKKSCNCNNSSMFLGKGMRICTTIKGKTKLSVKEVQNAYKIEEDDNVINIYLTKEDYELFNKRLSELN